MALKTGAFMAIRPLLMRTFFMYVYNFDREKIKKVKGEVPAVKSEIIFGCVFQSVRRVLETISMEK